MWGTWVGGWGGGGGGGGGGEARAETPARSARTHSHAHKRAHTHTDSLTHLHPPTHCSAQGYLPSDLYNLNSRYGSEQDLLAAIRALQGAGLKVGKGGGAAR